MHRRTILPLIAGIVCAVFLFVGHAMAKDIGEPISSFTIFNLSEEEIKSLKYELENKGNIDAAFRL